MTSHRFRIQYRHKIFFIIRLIDNFAFYILADVELFAYDFTPFGILRALHIYLGYSVKDSLEISACNLISAYGAFVSHSKVLYFSIN